jgi:LmbE family N-acetylglucosaminyl deacetylase
MKLFGSMILRAAVLLSALFLLAAPQRVAAQFPPAPGTGPGLAETVEAIDSARVTARILYITAHPDDESATLLTYLARGLHADVALLTLTRGEGGQNDLGPEQAPQLGLIRTQELLAATRGYGIKLFFGRAPDFGFSKTTEETQKVWGEAVLGDMVRVIRTFRPNIVINGWGGVHGGHGHHQTSGLWTPRAVELAADPKAFAEQLAEGLPVWGDQANAVQLLDTERGGATATASNGYALPVDEVSPLWGKTWREIGLDAFSNHRSQGITGFLGSPFLRRPLVLIREDGQKFDPSSLAEPLSQFGAALPRLNESFRRADQLLQKSKDQALQLDWPAAAKSVAAAARDVEEENRKLSNASGAAERRLHAECEPILSRIQHALALVAGVDLKAEANRSELVVGESFTVVAESRCRKGVGCALAGLQLNLPQEFKEIKREGDETKGYLFTVEVTQPAPALTIWARLLPEPPPLVFAEQEVTVDKYRFSVKTPVTHIAANSTRVDRVPLRIIPAYTLAVEPKQEIEALAKQKKTFDVLLRVHSYATQPEKISVGLDVPKGWTSSASMGLEFTGAGDKYAKLTVSPPQKLAAGAYTIGAYAKRGEEKFTTSLEPLPSLPTQFWEEPAQCVVRAFAINVPDNLRVGYITAEGEPIPEALRMLGIHVETLDAQALAFSDLSNFDAVVVGVRAYELRPELTSANQRLLDYVSNGGTLVVQYNRGDIWDKLQPAPAPYPALISPPLPPAKDGAPQTPRPLPRITDENSPVKFLKPDDPLLNTPNKITQDDFKGWVQERGLYYWTQFDPKYTPLLAMNDPGEPDLNGALVYTRYGKGTYIYTGLAFFRQLPEGVPGPYRLFVNLLCASRTR